MNQILTFNEISQFKDIGKYPEKDKDKLTPIIVQAQDVDLRDYLGMKFYFDVLSKLDNPDYQDLLSGSTFTVDGINYHHEGLKSMLADLFMAKYVMQINTNFTPFGATTKTSNDSEPADRNSLKDIAQMQLQMAGSKWQIIQLYLKSNKALFPVYNSTPDAIKSGERRFRIKKI